jgi:phage baseplate assembly protein W
MTHVDATYRFDLRGRTAEPPDDDAYIRGLIEQVLFTAPGERVNRPDFGCGLMHLVFQPGGTELAAATEFLVQGSLQQWLGDLIDVEAIAVEATDSTLRVAVQYVVRRTQIRNQAQFAREGPA